MAEDTLFTSLTAVREKLTQSTFAADPATATLLSAFCGALVAAPPEQRGSAGVAGGYAVLCTALATPSLAAAAAECIASVAVTDNVAGAGVRAAGALPLLIALVMQSPHAPAVAPAARALRSLAADSDEARDAIREGGGIAPLVQLLSAGPTADVTAAAAGALRNLARNNDANRDALREAGGIAPLVALLDAPPHAEVRSRRACTRRCVCPPRALRTTKGGCSARLAMHRAAGPKPPVCPHTY